MTSRADGLAVVVDSDPPPVDTRSLARRLVTRSAAIHQGDLVLVRGGARDIPLLEDLALEIRRAGANGLVELRTDRMARASFDEVPPKYDRLPDEIGRRLMGFLTATITVGEAETDTLFRGIPAYRLAARIETTRAVVDLAQRRGVREVWLGNGLYPSEARARIFGMTKAQLDQVFWRGVDVDYDALESTGDQVRRLLAGGTTLHLTHPNGTNLTVEVRGRPVFVSDGIISDGDQRRGGAATSVWLPAGEVFLTPVPGTAEGVVVADRYIYNGRAIDQFRLTFQHGRLAGMSAKSDMAELQAFYAAAPPGKDELGVIDVGINPNIAIPEGTSLAAWMPAGMVTLVLGANDWAGGDNHSVSGVNPFLAGTTLTVDGVVLVKDGRLRVPAPDGGGASTHP
ncbi:MAG TPA: aminopeptidase [Gemmatimonadales bacterium]|jgi:leucyl aminopeptidase (aminopeptidase T)|nr:aminopeptidase [Gemmatimonadales bacterium]